MKCPFLTKRIEVFDEEGNRIGEEIEIKDCIKNECMVYDGAAQMCSLLSSNMKTAVLIDNLKSGLKDIKEEIGQRTGAIGTVITDTIQTMQGTLQDRFEIIRKQIEIMVLGFDRLTEILTNKLGEIKVGFNDFTEHVSTMHNTVTEIKNANMQLSEEIKNFNETFFTKLTEYSEKLYPQIDVLNSGLEKLTTTNQTSMETIGQGIDKAVTASQEIIKKMDVVDNVKNEIAGLRTETLNKFDGIATKFEELSKVFSEAALEEFKDSIGNYIDGVKSEINNLQARQVDSLNTLQGTAQTFEEILRKSSENLSTLGTKMDDLNKNYLESLGKIAGLAKGMTRGVEKVGEGAHESVTGLINEMKKDADALEQQYERAFGDIAKLANKFEEINTQTGEMIKEVQKEFKNSFNRQAELSDYTKDILENIKMYFEKEEERYKEEQRMRRNKEGIDHFDRATLYYYRGNYELALTEINKALEIEARAEYLNLKGLLLAELGRFDESQKTYTEALKLEPNLAEIDNNLGLLYLKVKKLDDAVVAFQEAVKKNVNYALAYVNLGKALIDLERFDDAIEAYTRALEIDPSNQQASEAIKLYKEGKIGEQE